MDYRIAAPNLAAMHNLGILQIPGLPSAVAAPAEAGLFDPATLGKILRWYEQNKGLADFFINLFRGQTKPPVIVAPPAPIVIPPPPPAPPPAVVLPPAPAAREIAALGVRYYWANRKNTPYKEGGDRKMIDGDFFRRILAGEDPWQCGDRVTFDVTPSDQWGRPFVPGDAANVLMRGIEYEVVGDGELQLQDPDNIGFDPTPTIFVPWDPASGVKPGYQGELGLIARYTNPRTGEQIKSASPLTRIRPWAA